MSTDSSTRRVQLWGVGTARTLRPIWMAEELGIGYDLVPIGPRTGETQTPEYQALNPKQKIPLLIDGDVRLSESVAICRYLVTSHPAPAIWRPQTHLERAREDEWCCYVYGEIDETGLYVIRRHHDLEHIYGSAPKAVESAAAYVRRHLDVLERHLAGRDHLMDQGFGLADLLLTTCLDWSAHCGIELPPAVAGYRVRIADRPAYRRATQANRARENNRGTT
jgi:glutathione S-transferase